MKRVLLAERMGWTLDEIDRLSLADVNDVFAVMNAIERVRAQKRKMAAK